MFHLIKLFITDQSQTIQDKKYLFIKNILIFRISIALKSISTIEQGVSVKLI